MRLILESIRTILDARLREEQAGFRVGRSCTVQIATLRIIIEQSLETPLYVNFVNFKKAFDTVRDRAVMWKILRHYGIPQRVVSVMQGLYEDTACHVIHSSDLSPPLSPVGYCGYRN